MISRVVSTGMVGQVLGLLHDIILQASQHIGDSTAGSAQLVLRTGSRQALLCKSGTGPAQHGEDAGRAGVIAASTRFTETAQCGRPSSCSSNMVWLTHANKYQASIHCSGVQDRPVFNMTWPPGRQVPQTLETQAQLVGHSLSDKSTYRQ